MIILGIETSCDDTGIALIEGNRKGCWILSNIVSSQIKMHAPYGGIVPNLAAREHLKNIQPVLKEALEKSHCRKIDLIAVTVGPGLIPSLLVGVNFAKALAYKWQKPIIGINHIEGHIYANWLKPISEISNFQFLISKPKFPILCLVVSGGHTQLILMKGHEKYQLLGETRDDAAGEAFDKVAKLLNLGYPGGPIVSQKARKGNPQFFELPRPMLKTNDFDFSFSGLKTAVLYEVRKHKEQSPKDLGTVLISDMSASFQQAVIDVLVSKTIQAIIKYQVKTVMLAGGVAANQELRKQFGSKLSAIDSKLIFLVPPKNLCTDNAAMIAAAAWHKKRPASKKNWRKIQADANLKLIA
jgi:N6-L-threonylcarbamoyladenine synthase